MLDLTVASIPIYFGTMAAEQRYLAKRAAVHGPTTGDYTKEDTATSLAMGVGSLLAPLITPKLVKHVIPGKGKYGKVLVGATLAAAAATSIADRVVARAPDDAELDASSTDGRRRWSRLAAKVRRVTGPAAVATGTLATATFFASRTNPDTMWEKGEAHDRGEGAAAWIAAIAGWDFIYYWNHRFMHEIRAMWALHVVHHSSERYNLSTALRQPVADVLGVWIPYGLLARAGVRPHLISQARAINLLYQYWIHTETIRSIGPAEAVLNTASHHRVHHGSNSQYLDRNHGSILIVWDKLFGTFEPEDEPVVYGLTKNIDSFNPAVVASHEYKDILRDVADSDTWSDRLSFVLRGPGWAYERHRERAEFAASTAGVS
ncbi:sterol desaturase family protein [Actinospongicola halichondriae]|uniref:sterol desaturase family protein n=1 Tax=Actinospongicola halichondriae TaxID=3236844 RepID=UPI003D5A083F